MDELNLRDKAVLISGATAGIGFAAAKLFAAHGATVAITGRRPEPGAAALEELKALDSRCLFFQGDAGKIEDVDHVVSAAVAAMGRLDVMVSAGADNWTGLKPFADMSIEEIRATFDNLVYPRILPVHASIPHLQKNGGSIVMIGTDAARHTTPGESIVGATGAAVISMTKTLARELSQNRIRVNSIALTITSGTPGWDRAFAHPFGVKVFSKAVERFPFGRPPSADEVAQAILFLASDAASQVSGQTISVNGGLSFGGW